MVEFLQKWIQTKLGIDFSVQSPDFPEILRDGRIVSKLLYIYNIIDRTQLDMIVPCRDIFVMKENMEHVKNWLSKIGFRSYDDMGQFGVEGNINQILEKLTKINKNYKVCIEYYCSTIKTIKNTINTIKIEFNF